MHVLALCVLCAVDSLRTPRAPKKNPSAASRKSVCLESTQRRQEAWQTRVLIVPEREAERLRGAKRGGRGRARKSAETWHTETTYASRLRELLGLEREAEEALAKERLEKWPVAVLAKAGLTLLGLRARRLNGKHLFGRAIVRLELRRGGEKCELPYHKFGEGDLVTLRMKGSTDNELVEATVLERTPEYVDVAVNNGGGMSATDPFVKNKSWRMDQYYSTISFERMDAALDAICSESSMDPVLFEKDLLELELRRVLLRPEESPQLASARCGGLCQRVPTDESARRALASLSCSLDGSQYKAAIAALVSRAALIVGPPGTGKTRVAAATLAAAIRLRDAETRKSQAPLFRSKALACAASNVAADNLLEQLLKLDVKAVRLGNPAATRVGLRDATLEARVAKRLFGEGEDISCFLDDEEDARRSGLRAYKLRKEAAIEAVLMDCDVVVASCVGAGADLLAPFLNSKDKKKKKAPSWRFGMVLIDEAAQATEPACLVALAAARGARQVVLVGDAMQLAPTVISRRAAGLKLSLFERLQTAGVETQVLSKQYRMHPVLNAFSSKSYYADQVTTDRTVAAERQAAPPPEGFAWPNPRRPLCFISLGSGAAERLIDVGLDIATGSFSNDKEARTVARLAASFLREDSERDIGVITPYSAQARLISDELVGHAHVEVKTVDGYQGREKEIILISAVRSNAQGKVGFLSDPRRLNVALTRAQRAMVVVGDHTTLCKDPNWKNFIDHCMQLGCFVDASSDEDAGRLFGSDSE